MSLVKVWNDTGECVTVFGRQANISNPSFHSLLRLLAWHGGTPLRLPCFSAVPWPFTHDRSSCQCERLSLRRSTIVLAVRLLKHRQYQYVLGFRARVAYGDSHGYFHEYEQGSNGHVWAFGVQFVRVLKRC